MRKSGFHLLRFHALTLLRYYEDRLPPGRISGHSKEFALIVPNVSSFSGLSSCFGLSGFFSLLVSLDYLLPLVFLA